MSTRKTLAWPLIGTLAVLILSPALELLLGHEAYYLVPLPVLIILLWALTRLSRTEIGLKLGAGRAYLVALAIPFAVMTALVALAAATGQVDPDPEKLATWPRLVRNFFLNSTVGVLALMLTEEGFFRGWLWGSLMRTGLGSRGILVWTSLAFTVWHLPVAIIEEDFALPGPMIPVYLANVLLLGLQWGLLRLGSGSVIVPAVCHSVWNGLAYALFGYGVKTGALGIARYDVLGPERGLVGLVLNTLVVVLLWRWAGSGRSRP